MSYFQLSSQCLEIKNVVKQQGLSCLRYQHIQRLQGLYSCRTWILHYDSILSSCALVCSCICTCTLLLIIILGDWNWALKPTPLKLDNYFFPRPPKFFFCNFFLAAADEVFILLFCPWISFLLIPVVSNLWNTQPVIFRHFTQFTLARNTTKS